MGCLCYSLYFALFTVFSFSIILIKEQIFYVMLNSNERWVFCNKPLVMGTNHSQHLSNNV